MRLFLAALALAGALVSASLAASQPDPERMIVAQGASASDVLRAKRCAPPFGCPKQKPRTLAPKRESAPAMLALVDAAAAAQGVPVGIARALVRVESNFNPNRRGAEREIGLTQIKCGTARGLGFAGSCAALFDPATNLRWGLRHAHLALARGSIGFHQTGLHARRVGRAYVARINAAMR